MKVAKFCLRTPTASRRRIVIGAGLKMAGSGRLVSMSDHVIDILCKKVGLHAPQKTDECSTLHIEMWPDLKSAVAMQADELGISINQFILNAIDESSALIYTK